MRFCLGPIPASPDFVLDGSWKPLREPTPWLLQLMALPIACVLAAVFAWLWVACTPVCDFSIEVSPAVAVLLILGVIVVHELMHAAVHPRFGTSSRSLVGLWPSRLLFYAHYDGELSRNRFVAIFLAPLTVLSVVPLAIAAIARIDSPAMALLSILNALFSCGDVLGAVCLLLQTPSTATTRNQGWKTYWRSGDGAGAADRQNGNAGS